MTVLSNEEKILRTKRGQQELFKWLGRYCVEYSLLQNNFQELTNVLMATAHGVAEDVTKAFMTKTTMHQLADTYWCLCNQRATDIQELDSVMVSKICAKGNKIAVKVMEERNNFFHGVLTEMIDDSYPLDPKDYKFVRIRIKTSGLKLEKQNFSFDSRYLIGECLRVHNLAKLVLDLGICIADYRISDKVLTNYFRLEVENVEYLGERINIGETL